MATTRAKGEGMKSAFAAEKKGKEDKSLKLNIVLCTTGIKCCMSVGDMRTTYRKFPKLHSMCA